MPTVVVNCFSIVTYNCSMESGILVLELASVLSTTHQCVYNQLSSLSGVDVVTQLLLSLTSPPRAAYPMLHAHLGNNLYIVHYNMCVCVCVCVCVCSSPLNRLKIAVYYYTHNWLCTGDYATLHCAGNVDSYVYMHVLFCQVP